MKATTVQKQLRQLGSAEDAAQLSRFFKTGKGEYGEGDVFLGIRVPVLRRHLKQFRELALDEILKVLKSKYHEERLFAVLMLVDQYRRGDESTREQIYRQYLAHTDYINNWDIIDQSAHYIVGAWLFERSRKPLYRLVKSPNLWERRIAILATYYMIRQDEFDETLKIAALLLNDEEDLIHKATGWMLREVGKRDLAAEKAFLKSCYRDMPRTMLRYAIEKFPEPERKRYLSGKI